MNTRYGAGDRTRTCTLSQRNLNPPSLPIPPRPHWSYSTTANIYCQREIGKQPFVVLCIPRGFLQSFPDFQDFFLTFQSNAGTIDSVWCTLAGLSPKRFMITSALAGVAYCASWRFLCLIHFTGYWYFILQIEQHGVLCARSFGDAFILQRRCA